jgi:hypothetical protein
MKAYYKRNPTMQAPWSGKRRKAIRAMLAAAKDRPCADCGVEYHYCVMDFDHVRGKKSFTIAEAINKRFSDEVILAEIEKCEVVCSNCHRLRTWRRLSDGVTGSTQGFDP